MALEEIDRLRKALSLEDDEVPVLTVSKEAQSEGRMIMEKCLVGKIPSNKKVNREAFKAVLQQVWNTCRQSRSGAGGGQCIHVEL